MKVKKKDHKTIMFQKVKKLCIKQQTEIKLTGINFYKHIFR